jgi:hypothetical protein
VQIMVILSIQKPLDGEQGVKILFLSAG